MGLPSRFAGWCRMKHTVACKAYTIFCFVFLLVSFMFFGFNTNHINRFKAGNKSMDASPHHDKKLSTTLDANKLYFQWGNPVWNENTSSKHLVPGLQKIKRYFIQLNMYNVTFPNTTERRKHSAIDLLCRLKNVTMETVKATDLPISDSNWTSYLPLNALSDVVGNLKQCAVVSSSGAMKSSGLGPEIDAHDAVLRFNAAPTEGFEADVGTKTTIRIINSQVVADPTLHFMNESFYQSGSLIMWDPGLYYAPLYKWFKTPEFNFTENYQAYRLKNPTQPFYILNPNVLWHLWDIIQANTLEDIQPNPPSSGLTGIVLMMSLCDEVDVYEYLPSRRKTDLCHYFEKPKNEACMWGAYHPVIFEKNLIKQLNMGTDDNIYLYGKVTLPGFSKVQCKLG
ncbi:beta-galactoside alpha-2,6-sialyltransferase 1-like isoform X2 [Ambystoma mexicanum]